jgi:hypothetical protein
LFNKYIQTSVGTLVIEKDNRLSNIGSILFEGCFVVIGFATIYLGFAPLFSVETYIFDKNASTLTIKKRGITVNEVTEGSLSEVSEVKLETIYGENCMLYEVCLLINEGDRLSLGGSSNQKEQQKIADWIRSYLDGRSN